MRARANTVLGACLLLALASPVRGQPGQPPEARAVRVDEHLGTRLPPHLAFTNPRGERVTLSELSRENLPIVMVLAYARCRMLCSWVLRGFSEALPQLSGLEPGHDYLPVVVSIDPRETVRDAGLKQASLLERAGFPGEPWRLTYLIGPQANVQRLADALGFRFAWDPRSEQYAHPAVISILTPDLRVSGYLYGVRFEPRALEQALTAASVLRSRARGRASTGEAQAALGSRQRYEAGALLRCFRFDAGAHRYAAQIQSYFRAAAVVILLSLACFLGWLFLWERRRAR